MSTRRERLTPLPPERWSEDTHRLLGGTLERVAELEGESGSAGSGPLNILRTIAHHPRLLEPFLTFAATLATAGTLPRRDSELLALRAAWNCRSPFEWGHHVLYARAAGLDDREIERVAAGLEHPDWSAGDAALLRAADELHARQDWDDATWDSLRERFEPAQVLEIAFVVGHYTMLSMVANATGVPLEEDLPPMPRS